LQPLSVPEEIFASAASRDQSAIAAADATKLFEAGSTNYLDVLDANLALITEDQSLAMLDGKIVDDQNHTLSGAGRRLGIAAAVGA
jgi:outer membrane protein TolC